MSILYDAQTHPERCSLPHRDTGVERRLEYECLIRQYRRDRHIQENDVLNFVRGCLGIR